MNAKEFVASWKAEKDEKLCEMLAGNGYVGAKLRELSLSSEQIDSVVHLLDSFAIDILYTLLFGLDGAAGVGDALQQPFELRDQGGGLVYRGGELQVEAFEQLQETPTSLAALKERALLIHRQRLGETTLRAVKDAHVTDSGSCRCPHCGRSFVINSLRSWDGEKHRTCGGYLRLVKCSDRT
ncbi:hypothetical protein [Pseudomonas sp. EA_35y_Pfl2_R5]|uniref:hypothetical protein n=1 Tax=Pseudomonas sp. EA_35y_Pfl2_R5 TaxID=3088690 RepID=UPI0030DB3668